MVKYDIKYLKSLAMAEAIMIYLYLKKYKISL